VADPSLPAPTAAQVAQARAAAQAAASALDAADAARADAQRQLDALDARIEAQVERWNAARAEADAARTVASLAQRDAATARVASVAAQADIDRLAVASYQVGADLSGGLGEWAAIVDSAFGPDGIQGLADRTTAVTQVTADRRRDLDAARDLALVALQQEAAAGRAAAALKAEQESQKAEVARLVAIRDAASATLSTAQARAGSLARTRAAAIARARVAARAAAKARAEAERRARERERDTGGQVPRDEGSSRSWPEGSSVTTAARRRGAVDFAIRQIGDPYVAGENGPDAYDCSGLTQAAYRAVGHEMIQYSVAQFAAGRKIPVGQLQPGDLVFYANDTSDWTTIHHVGIYEGGGVYVEAPHTGDHVKRLTIWTDGLMAYGARP
jgi:cell wall-associated NlpC family hydrolase